MREEQPLGPTIEEPDAEGFRGVIFGGNGHNATYGRIEARTEGETIARVRVPTGPGNANIRGSLHGGAILSFLDQALFVGPAMLGNIQFAQAVTLGVSTQFLAAGTIGVPLDCVVEIVRETGRLLFLRGTMEQGGDILVTYQATVRKFTPRPDAG